MDVVVDVFKFNMTREEQILNKAIDYSFVEENFLEYDDCGDVCDDRDFIQRAFEEGAKWADKTMIEKACKWLKDNLADRIYNRDCYLDTFTELFIEDFSKAMKENDN